MNEAQEIDQDETFLSYLQKEFEIRKSKNSSYSIRAFARLLDVDQSLLSKFFRGKADFHWRTIDHCLHKLNASEKVISFFKEQKFTFASDYQPLEEEIVTAMGDWRYWAILEYFKINPSADHSEIATRLELSEKEVAEIIPLLLKLRFIESDGEKYIILKPNTIWVDPNKTTEARKKIQKDISLMSAKSIDEHSLDSRYHCFMTVAVDKDRLPEFKEKLNSILIELGKYMQKNNTNNEVYQLNLGFFPLTVSEEK